MSNVFKKSVIGTAVALGLLAGGQAMASELTANVGVVSNYVFRGESQNVDHSAIQGGIDYSHDSGFHIGTWTSSLNGGGSSTAYGYELDVYGGYSFDVAGVGMDVGYISYMYPEGKTYNVSPSSENKYDFQEIYVSASYGMFNAKYSFSDDYLGYSQINSASKKSAYYVELGMDYPLKDDLSLGLHVGQKGGAWFDDSATRSSVGTGAFTDYKVSLTKGEFSFAVSNTDNKKASVGSQSDNYRVIVGWTHNITL